MSASQIINEGLQSRFPLTAYFIIQHQVPLQVFIQAVQEYSSSTIPPTQLYFSNIVGTVMGFVFVYIAYLFVLDTMLYHMNHTSKAISQLLD